MTNTAEFVNRIHQVRVERNLSIAKLSEISGVADKTLRRKLNAPERFTLSEVIAIARALETPIEVLVASYIEVLVDF